MGAGPAGGNSGGGSPNQMAKDKAKKDRIATAKTKDKFGYTKPKSKFKTFIEGGGVIGAVTKPFMEKTGEINRKFFNEKVVPAGKIKKGTTYESYMKARLAGKTDAYGNPISQGDNGGGNDNNQTVLDNNANAETNLTQPVTAPTTAEISQSEAADADDIYTRKKKSKARGRSMMTLTSSKGVTDNKLTLGKPSLLGS